MAASWYVVMRLLWQPPWKEIGRRILRCIRPPKFVTVPFAMLRPPVEYELVFVVLDWGCLKLVLEYQMHPLWLLFKIMWEWCQQRSSCNWKKSSPFFIGSCKLEKVRFFDTLLCSHRCLLDHLEHLCSAACRCIFTWAHAGIVSPWCYSCNILAFSCLLPFVPVTGGYCCTSLLSPLIVLLVWRSLFSCCVGGDIVWWEVVGSRLVGRWSEPRVAVLEFAPSPTVSFPICPLQKINGNGLFFVTAKADLIGILAAVESSVGLRFQLRAASYQHLCR
jgi:hypothetical protein